MREMLARSSSSAALGAVKPCKVLPTRAEDYELLEEIGQGVSAKARPQPVGLLCAALTRLARWDVCRCGGRTASR